MTPDELRAIGERLAEKRPDIYGRGWQSALARELGVWPRTVRYWLQGQRRISEPMARYIRLVAERE